MEGNCAMERCIGQTDDRSAAWHGKSWVWRSVVLSLLCANLCDFPMFALLDEWIVVVIVREGSFLCVVVTCDRLCCEWVCSAGRVFWRLAAGTGGWKCGETQAQLGLLCRCRLTVVISTRMMITLMHHYCAMGMWTDFEVLGEEWSYLMKPTSPLLSS